MNKFYNDFYTKFGRTVHDIREQQEQDIVEYAENGLTEDDIVILTDIDRRRVREIIGNIKSVQEETELNEFQGYDSIVSKDKTASAMFKIGLGLKVVRVRLNLKVVNLLLMISQHELF